MTARIRASPSGLARFAFWGLAQSAGSPGPARRSVLLGPRRAARRPSPRPVGGGLFREGVDGVRNAEVPVAPVAHDVTRHAGVPGE